MATCVFTLIVEGVELTDEHVDALYEAGCRDSLIGRTNGVQYIYMHRGAPSCEEALRSAVATVEEAVEGAKVVRCFTDDQEAELDGFLQRQSV